MHIKEREKPATISLKGSRAKIKFPIVEKGYWDLRASKTIGSTIWVDDVTIFKNSLRNNFF